MRKGKKKKKNSHSNHKNFNSLAHLNGGEENSNRDMMMRAHSRAAGGRGQNEYDEKETESDEYEP